MAEDAELERLKSDQQRAFQRKQDAWQAQDRAWKARKAAEDALKPAIDRQTAAYAEQQRAWQVRRSAQADTSRAYDAKQPAYERQQEAWEELQRLRDAYGPRIGELKDEHDRMFERIKSLSSDIDDAFNYGNRESAFGMIEEVKQLRSDIRDLPPRWREWSNMIREAKEAHASVAEEFRPLQAEFVRLRAISDAAKADHEAAERDFKAAKAERDRLQATFDTAKAEHGRLNAEFRDAKAEAERAMEAFQARLAELKREQQQRQNDKREAARLAGVPSQYWDDLYVSTDDDGNINIYFGGIGEPVGPGHGHYVMDRFGNVTYARDPEDNHGAQNFTDFEEKQREREREREERRQRRGRSSPSQQRRNAAQHASTWTPAASQPPDGGIIAGTEGGLENIVSFKTGGPTGDHTLIADGDFTGTERGEDGLTDNERFTGPRGARNHNHYGSAQEGGWIDEDRGKYTGPDH